MGKYADKNAKAVLEKVESAIKELELIQGKVSNPDYARYKRTSWRNDRYAFRIDAICDELSIFDWWNETLSIAQLKQMKRFIESAIKLGFNGYVCFKVGATGCSHGMWASTVESTNGYSPNTGNTLYHSFRCTDNYWDAEINEQWLSKKFHKEYDAIKLADIKDALANV